MKAKMGVLLAVLLVLCALMCAVAAAEDDPLSGTAWLGSGETLYVFGNDGEATIVRRDGDSGIEARELFYRLDGPYVLLRGTQEDDGTWLLIGDLSSGQLYIEGQFPDRLEIPAEEPAEVPGIAGGWTDAEGATVMLLQPNGRMDSVDISIGRRLVVWVYKHYGPYVVFDNNSETIWGFYNAEAEELEFEIDTAYRIPLEEAIALGLDMDSEPVFERPRAEWLYDTAWLGSNDTLYVFGDDYMVTIVQRDEEYGIEARKLPYRLDGYSVLLLARAASDDNSAEILRGEFSRGELFMEGDLLARLEIPEEEPTEAPGIAGGWTDEAGNEVLLLHPDGRVDGFVIDSGEQMPNLATYTHYGPYVLMLDEWQTIWIYYETAADELRNEEVIACRIPLGQAIALGLDVSPAHLPEPTVPEPITPPEPAATQGGTEYDGTRADWLQDTVWLGTNGTLCAFGHYGEVTVVHRDEDGAIMTRSLYYLTDGADVLLQEMANEDGENKPVYQRGGYAGERLIFDGVPYERLEMGEGGEATEAPGIAGGWADETGTTLLLHPDGRLTMVGDADGAQPGGMRYAHYGQYVMLAYGQETGWILYDAAADELGDGKNETAFRIPLEQALAYGLGQEADIQQPSVDLTGEWVAETGEWLHIADGKLSYASRSLSPEMPYTVEEDGTLAAYFETNLTLERFELGYYWSDEAGEGLRLEQDYHRATADGGMAKWSTPGWVALMADIQTEGGEVWAARAQRIEAGAPEAEPMPDNIGRVTLALDGGAMERYFGSAADNAVCESISPDGNCLLAVVNGLLVLVDLPTGEGRVVTPDYTRSAGNAQTGLNNFEMVLSYWKPQYFGAEEAAWSPDGRYAVFTCRRMAVVQVNFLMDLFVVDTLHAQVYDAASFGTQPMRDDGAGTVTGACFGEDGMLYYLLYSPAVKPMALMRCDLETGQSEFLYQYPSDALSLQWLDGRLLCVGSPYGNAEPFTIYSYATRADVLEDQTLRLPLLAWPQQLSVSRKSGMGLTYTLLDRQSAARGAFSVLDTRDSFAGYSRILLLTAEGTAVEQLDAAQWLDLAAQGKEVMLNTLSERYRFCANAQLTDGGEYALLLHGAEGRCAMSLLRLRDLALFPVDAQLSQEQLAGCVYDTQQGTKYPAGYRCFPGGWMIVGGQLARLEIEPGEDIVQ